MLHVIKLYTWQGLDRYGDLCHGKLRARNIGMLRQQLKQQAITLLHTKCRWYFGRQVNSTNVLYALKLLAKQLHAGVPLSNALQHLSNHTEHPVLQDVFTSVLRHVQGGQALSFALQHYQVLFPSTLITMLAAGEQTGSSADMLTTFVQLTEQRSAIRKQLIASIRYPLFLLATAITTTCVMLIFVVPQFATLFTDAGKALPMLTAMVLAASDVVRADGGLLFLALLLSAVLAIRYWPCLAPKIPWIKQLHREQHWAQWCFIIGTLIEHGIALTPALQQARAALPDCYHSWHDTLAKKLAQGQSLDTAWQTHPAFNDAHRQLLSTLSKQGELGSALLQVANHMQQQLQHHLQKLNQRLSPILLFLIAGLTGVLIIALYLPIFQLGSLL